MDALEQKNQFDRAGFFFFGFTLALYYACTTCHVMFPFILLAMLCSHLYYLPRSVPIYPFR